MKNTNSELSTRIQAECENDPDVYMLGTAAPRGSVILCIGCPCLFGTGFDELADRIAAQEEKDNVSYGYVYLVWMSDGIIEVERKEPVQ